ncbi:substrate-binding periplasmic protein [Paucibacter soli]|uniref:substrate-binding periplasmic protein n=1 Tax=Paucibacter soli TaxID=3133433 RepID=UPI00309F0897
MSPIPPSCISRWTAALLLGVSSCAWAAPAVPLCASEFPPYSGAQLPGQGVMIELAAQAFKRQGLQASASFMPWARVIKLGEQGACIIVGIWRNEQRDQLYSYSRPMLRQELGFFARMGSAPDLRRLQDLRLGVERGSYVSAELQEPGLQIDLASDQKGNFRKLALGRVDLVFSERATGQFLLAAEPELGRQIEWRAPRLEFKNAHLAMSKNHPQARAWLDAFDLGLAAMKADGSYARLLARASISQAD